MNDHELAVRFGARLRVLRRAAGLNQRELGDRCGSRQATIAQLEAGLHCPSFPLLHRLAAALGTSPAAFWAE